MDTIVQQLRDLQFAMRKDEVWRQVDFTDFLTPDLQPAPSTLAAPQPEAATCAMTGLDTDRITLLNGRYDQPLRHFPNGVVIGGLREAMKQCPELVSQCQSHLRANPYEQLNAQHFTDGLFIYIPDHIQFEKPLQIQSLVSSADPLCLQVRHKIYVGRNSALTLIHCDDSHDGNRSFSNNVTEIAVADDAHLQYYKLQNLNDASALLSHAYVSLAAGASLNSCAVTLNGGSIRNHTEVRMLGQGCEVQANGLYLIDKSQQADNYIFVEHAHPHCNSRELFKGIIDDSAQATFNGHVLVADGAVKTEAYQSNKNILLTDKAIVNTKPFLEIYNDDVKCSHGSTIGQLDEQALFYIRSRGISERTAKTLLLYAFCDEVIQGIQLPALRESLSDMVKKRLHGELTPCADCALQCNTPCNGPQANFTIDPSRL